VVVFLRVDVIPHVAVKNAPAVFRIFVHHPRRLFQQYLPNEDIIVKYVHPICGYP